jgi:hypothetical protein
MKNTALEIERVFRDLRSATLMYHNDRLLGANGKLILVEDSGAEAIWKHFGELATRVKAESHGFNTHKS